MACSYKYLFPLYDALFEAVSEGIPYEFLPIVLGLSSSINCSKSRRYGFCDQPRTVLLLPCSPINERWITSGAELLVGKSLEVHGVLAAEWLAICEQSGMASYNA